MATQNSINTPLPVAAPKGGTGVVSPTIHGIMIAQGASPMNNIVLGDGQLLIGSSGNDPVAASITAGTGVSVTPSAGGITIAATGAFTWVDVATGTQALAINKGYVTTNATLVTYSLPAVAAVGSVIKIVGKGAAGWLLAQGASQSIGFGDITTTVGVGGSLASTNLGDSIELVNVTANTGWRVISSVGNITYV